MPHGDEPYRILVVQTGVYSCILDYIRVAYGSICDGKMEEPTTEPNKESKTAQVKGFYSWTEHILYQALYSHRQYSVSDGSAYLGVY